jgi:hypothetical protein
MPSIFYRCWDLRSFVIPNLRQMSGSPGAGRFGDPVHELKKYLHLFVTNSLNYLMMASSGLMVICFFTRSPITSTARKAVY